MAELNTDAEGYLWDGKFRFDKKAVEYRIDEQGVVWDGVYWFDKRAGNRRVNFFKDHLRHFKGEHAGKPFVLEEWEKKIVMNVYGWKKKNGFPRYKHVFIFLPKGQGKSALVGGLVLCEMFVGEEEGAEVYAAAGSKEQAGIVFDYAEKMFNASDLNTLGGKVVYKSLVYPKRNSIFETVSADADLQAGITPSLILFDEFFNQPNADLYTMLKTSMKKRRSSRMIIITTAGDDKNSICYEKYKYAKDIMAGKIKDDTFYPVVYEAEPEDDWKDPAVWRKASPNYNVTVFEEDYQSEMVEAVNSPSLQSKFKQFNLNLWVSSQSAWLNQERWKKGYGRPITGEAFRIEDFKGCSCAIAQDLSETTDLTALSVVFDEGGYYYQFPYFWMPKELIKTRTFDDKVPYDVWAADDFIIPCPGYKISQRMVLDTIEGLVKDFKVDVMMFDPWHSKWLSEECKLIIPSVEEFRQNPKWYAAPTDFYEACVLDGKLRHNPHPVLDWCAGNVEVDKDKRGNKMPCKPEGRGGQRKRIDGIVSGIMGLAPYMEGAKKSEFTPDPDTYKAVFL